MILKGECSVCFPGGATRMFRWSALQKGLCIAICAFTISLVSSPARAADNVGDLAVQLAQQLNIPAANAAAAIAALQAQGIIPAGAGVADPVTAGVAQAVTTGLTNAG